MIGKDAGVGAGGAIHRIPISGIEKIHPSMKVESQRCVKVQGVTSY